MAGSWKKDVDKLLRRAERLGCRVERRRAGHIRVLPPNPQYPPITISATPSDSRAVMNTRALLRRSGVAL